MTHDKNKPENVKIDSKTLHGLEGVSSHQKGKLNPKHVVVCLINEDLPFIRSIEPFSNSVIFTMPKFEKSGLDSELMLSIKLAEHVKKYGKIEELWIHGHGQKMNMFDAKGEKHLGIYKFLSAIWAEKDDGIKIADRVVFAGCNTFSHLSNNDIKSIRNMADKTDIEIVGTTSSAFGNKTDGVNARFVQFTPKGEVIRDRIDDRFPISILAIHPKNALEILLDDDRSWVDFHLNHTQKEGENLRNNHIKREQESKKYWDNFLNKLSKIEHTREH